jgi:hypothetical protein
MVSTQSILTTLAGATTISVITLTSSSVNALTLVGGFGFSGTANLVPDVGTTNPTSVTATFNIRNFNQASGSFSQIIPAPGSDPGNSFDFIPNPLTFTQQSGAFYNSEQLVIQFGTQTIGGVTDTLTVTVNANQFFRNADAVSSSMVNFGQIGATASFGGTNTPLSGSYSINDSISANGTFSLSFTAFDVPSVPEPSSYLSFLILGCLGGGLMVKRALSGKI